MPLRPMPPAGRAVLESVPSTYDTCCAACTKRLIHLASRKRTIAIKLNWGIRVTSISLTDTAEDLTPVRSNERIQALDVVRGIALIGIFLMNVEYFNRPLNDLATACRQA